MKTSMIHRQHPQAVSLRPLRRTVHVKATNTPINTDKPQWTGEENKVSQIVDSLIKIEPLYDLMSFFARRVIINTAEKNGIPWRETAKSFDNRDVYAEFKALKNPDIEYPSYYTVPFHAYNEGNLNWRAAFEAVPATYSMAIRVWPKEKLTPDEAQTRLRGTFTSQIKEYVQRKKTREPKQIMDFGCSVGISTDALISAFPNSEFTGLDLSPHFLAVASYRDKQRSEGPRVTWLHRQLEKSGLPEASFDMICIQFVFHECPDYAIQDMLAECKRLLRPGGVCVMCDNNPKSKVIQGLPPAIFTLMKSTEPWSNSYYACDIEGIYKQLGFQDVEYKELDPRHRTIIAHKPF